jgi:hypothetical protein
MVLNTSATVLNTSATVLNTSATVEHISNTYNIDGKRNSSGQDNSGGAWNGQQVAPLHQR